MKFRLYIHTGGGIYALSPVATGQVEGTLRECVIAQRLWEVGSVKATNFIIKRAA